MNYDAFKLPSGFIKAIVLWNSAVCMFHLPLPHNDLIQGVRLQLKRMSFGIVVLGVFRYFLTILVISGPRCDSNLIKGYFYLVFASCFWA